MWKTQSCGGESAISIAPLQECQCTACRIGSANLFLTVFEMILRQIIMMCVGAGKDGKGKTSRAFSTEGSGVTHGRRSVGSTGEPDAYMEPAVSFKTDSTLYILPHRLYNDLVSV